MKTELSITRDKTLPDIDTVEVLFFRSSVLSQGMLMPDAEFGISGTALSGEHMFRFTATEPEMFIVVNGAKKGDRLPTDYYIQGFSLREGTIRTLDCRRSNLQYADRGRYRFGFNGMEQDNEVKGNGNSLDFGARIYDSRSGRFLSIDPLTRDYPWYTPYQFAGNKPIWCIDFGGLGDIPANGVILPQPYTTELLIQINKNHNWANSAIRNGETVVLILDYKVIQNKTGEIHSYKKQIILNSGDLNMPINKITQRATFDESGYMQSTMVANIDVIQFGSKSFSPEMSKLYDNQVPIDMSIYFGQNSKTIKNLEEVKASLKPIADFLNLYPDAKLTISGSTDAEGAIDDNNCIKQADDNAMYSIREFVNNRADSVIDLFIETYNVNPNQVIRGEPNNDKEKKANITVSPN